MMTDEELIAWMRSLKGLGWSNEAADRIVELLEEGQVMADKLDKAEIRIKRLEAKLAEAGKVLESVIAAEAICRSEDCFQQAAHFKDAADTIRSLIALAAMTKERDEVSALALRLQSECEELHGEVNDAVSALAIERAKVAKLVEAAKALGLRELVAGWNGEGKDKPYTPHPAHLWATIKTTCGVVYALDAAITEAGK